MEFPVYPMINIVGGAEIMLDEFPIHDSARLSTRARRARHNIIINRARYTHDSIAAQFAI